MALEILLFVGGPTLLAGWIVNRSWVSEVVACLAVGPIGIAAAYYAMLGERETTVELWPYANMMIVVSVLAHGVTATPLARTLGARLDAKEKA